MKKLNSKKLIDECFHINDFYKVGVYKVGSRIELVFDMRDIGGEGFFTNINITKESAKKLVKVINKAMK